MQCWSRTAAKSQQCACGRPPRATAVAVYAVKRARQYVARKDLQKAAKHEYLKQFYEQADRVETDHLVYELKPSSPRLRAQQQQHAQNAELNRQLVQQIPLLHNWQQLQEFVLEHSSVLNFLAVVALAAQAEAICQTCGPPPEPECAAVLPELAALLLQASSWFQPAHFAAAAVAMCACRVEDAEFWDNLVAAAEHKVGACSFQQLTQILVALAMVGFVPDLQWLERCYRQASKHLHAADAGDICSLIWAWGEMGYTPRDRLFLNQVKITTRRAFDAHELSGMQLVQLMHGLARMPKYAPNPGWLLALCKEVQQQRMEQLSPGDVVNLFLSLAALGYQPPNSWLDAALARLSDGFSPYSSSNDSTTASQQSLLPLLLPPPAQQQQYWDSVGPAGTVEPRLLRASSAEQQVGGIDLLTDVPHPDDIQQLQDMFAAAGGGGGGTAAATPGDKGGLQGADTTQLGQVTKQQQQQLEALSPSSSSRGQATQEQQRQQQHFLTVDQLGILCWCLGRLATYKPSPRWVQQLAQQLLLHAPAASGEVVVDALMGCITLGYLPLGQLQQQLLARAFESVPSLQTEALRRLCQALVGLEQGLEDAIAAQVLPGAAEQQQQRRLQAVPYQLGDSSSSTFSSLAAAALQQYVEDYKTPLAEAIAHRQGVILWQSSTQQLADVFAYLAAAGVKPSPDYMATGISRAVGKLADGAPTASVATLLWAVARLGFKPNPQLLHLLLAALQRGLHVLSSQDLADVGWALCTLKHRPGATWLSLYMQQVVSKVPYMSEQALTDTLWALACFAAQPDREWLKRVLAAAGSAQLSSRNAAVVMWALQQLGFQPDAEEWGLGQGSSGGDVESAVVELMQSVLQQHNDRQLMTLPVAG